MRVCVDKNLAFDYVNPPPLNEKLLLLTKGGVLVLGPWKGDPIGYNKTYIGWHPLPSRNKDLERTLGYL